MPVKKSASKSPLKTEEKEKLEHINFIINKNFITSITFDFNAKKFRKNLMIYVRILFKYIEIRKAKNKYDYYAILRFLNIQWLRYEKWFNKVINNE